MLTKDDHKGRDGDHRDSMTEEERRKKLIEDSLPDIRPNQEEDRE